MKQLASLFLLTLALAAFADDGILYTNGAPRLMKGQGTIRMVQEFVRVKIGKEDAKVYCRFVLRNEGPAANVRIGFPDYNDHEGEEGNDEAAKKAATPDLQKFRSVVDGKPAPVTFDATNYPENYHVKWVRFKRGQTRIVEDWYTSPLSGGATNTPSRMGYYASEFYYAMFSGGSWKGPIGQATFVVEFQGGQVPRPIVAKHLSTLHLASAYMYTHWDTIPKNEVVWLGFARPRVTAKTLTFRRRNFKPTRDSDIHLYFAPMSYADRVAFEQSGPKAASRQVKKKRRP